MKTIILKYRLLILFFLCFIICLDIEFQGPVLFPCSDSKTARILNKLFLSLSYSYISASLFHFFVIYCPHKTKQNAVRGLIKNMIRDIQELSRLYKMAPVPFVFDIDKLSKNEYVQNFDDADLYTKYIFDNRKTIKDYLEECRAKLKCTAYDMLSYRTYLTEEQFNFAIFVANSYFLQNAIFAKNVDCPASDCFSNQKEIGESIYDLYQEARKQKI